MSTPSERSPAYVELDELVRLRQKASGFSFLPRQPVHSILAGRYASKLRGRGLNFEELRAYVPGDDTRNIDWKVTARTSEPFVRVYTEEKDRPVWLLVDQRTSMFFASAGRMKSVRAAETAAVAAWRTLAQGDRCGAIVFDDTDMEIIPPQRSEETVSRILQCIVSRNQALNARFEGESGPQMLDKALKRAASLATHDGLVCVISDGFGVNPDTRRHVTRLCEHNDVLVAFVYDPMEADMPDAGTLMFADASGQYPFDSKRSKWRNAYAEEFQLRMQRMQELSRQHAIPVLPLVTDKPVLEQIRHLLGQR